MNAELQLTTVIPKQIVPTLKVLSSVSAFKDIQEMVLHALVRWF